MIPSHLTICNIIQDEVCSYFNITRKMISSPSREIYILWPRQIFFTITYRHFKKNLLRISYSELGSFLGSFDHATVYNSIKSLDSNILSNNLKKQEYKYILRTVYMILGSDDVKLTMFIAQLRDFSIPEIPKYSNEMQKIRIMKSKIITYIIDPQLSPSYINLDL